MNHSSHVLKFVYTIFMCARTIVYQSSRVLNFVCTMVMCARASLHQSSPHKNGAYELQHTRTLVHAGSRYAFHKWMDGRMGTGEVVKRSAQHGKRGRVCVCVRGGEGIRETQGKGIRGGGQPWDWECACVRACVSECVRLI